MPDPADVRLVASVLAVGTDGAEWFWRPVQVVSEASGPGGTFRSMPTGSAGETFREAKPSDLIVSLVDEAYASQLRAAASEFDRHRGGQEQQRQAMLHTLLDPGTTSAIRSAARVGGDRPPRDGGRVEVTLSVELRVDRRLEGLPFEALELIGTDRVGPIGWPGHDPAILITSVELERRPALDCSTVRHPLPSAQLPRVLVLWKARIGFDREAMARRLAAALGPEAGCADAGALTRETLEAALGHHRPHVVVVLSEGRHPAERGGRSVDGCLELLEDGTPLSGADFAAMLPSSVRAVVTSACWSATGTFRGRSVASSLLDAGLPIVVAANGEFPTAHEEEFVTEAVTAIVAGAEVRSSVRSFRQTALSVGERNRAKDIVDWMPVVLRSGGASNLRASPLLEEPAHATSSSPSVRVEQAIGWPPVTVELSGDRCGELRMPSRIAVRAECLPANLAGSGSDAVAGEVAEALNVLSHRGWDVAGLTVVTTVPPEAAGLPARGVGHALFVATVRAVTSFLLQEEGATGSEVEGRSLSAAMSAVGEVSPATAPPVGSLSSLSEHGAEHRWLAVEGGRQALGMVSERQRWRVARTVLDPSAPGQPEVEFIDLPDGLPTGLVVHDEEGGSRLVTYLHASPDQIRRARSSGFKQSG